MKKPAAAGLVLAGALMWGGLASAEPPRAVTVTNVSIGTTSTALIGASTTARLLLIISNHDANEIFCDLNGGTAVADQGVRISASSTLVLENSVPSTAVNCISITAASDTSATEGLK